MSIRVRIPTPFRKLTGGHSELALEATTVREAIDTLEALHPGLREKMFTETGALRRFVAIYVNQNDIRTLNDLATPVKDGDSLAIVPAIAGGR
jgi:molybdopterin synthase sulfur carrier subunit